MFLLRFCLVSLVMMPSLAWAEVPKELTDYIARPEAKFAWKKGETQDTPQGKVYNLKLTSQTWQGIDWEHDLQIVVPKDVKPQATMLLWNQGGTPSAGTTFLTLQIAERVKAPVAFLYGIPKQPLFEGKKEDALIAHTFVKFLETKDASWPLLFPMAKSLIKTMDVIQAFAKEEWQFEVKKFVVTGASKRGWTSWLTAASGDPRVKAIAPLVIDTLNFPVQMQNQLKAFGKPSLMIADYTRAGLVPIPDTTEAKRLWQMVDPWVYREKITVPKFLIHGTNDPYWPQDALNSYWNDLKGDKYVLYVPNAGHDLREVGENKTKQTFPQRAVDTLSAFARSQVFDKPMPSLTWETAEKLPYIMTKPVGTVKRVLKWKAESETRDFRESRWTSEEVLTNQEKKRYDGTLEVGLSHPKTTANFTAFFGEIIFDFDGIPLHMSTQIQILEGAKK
ncbi:MAG: PhoPQ-activated pathogenicity-related family protein [Fimbriiglobus sp.]